MNGQSQPGTDGYIQPTINAQGDAFRTMSSQYSQEANVFGSLDKAAARRQGEQLAREAMAGFESVIKDSKAFDQFISKCLSGIDSFQQKNELTGKALKVIKDHYKDITNAQEKATKAQEALNLEYQKAEPSQEKILNLQAKLVKSQSDLEALVEQTSNMKRIAMQEQEKQNAVLEDSVDKEERIAEANKKILGLKRDNNKISAQQNDLVDDYIDKLEKSNKLMKESKTTLQGVVSSFRDSLSTIYNGLDKLNSAFNISDKIKRWTMELDEYTRDTYKLANTWGTDYKSGFQSFKNSLLGEIGEGGAFNPNQLNQAMTDLSHFSFENANTLKGMARDLTFAKEYMGMQNDTLVDMYGMQLRSADDTYLKKTMATVISLQKSGLQISEDQLNATVKSSMTLTDAMAANGMSYSDISNFQSSLIELMSTADATMGPGSGERIKSQIESIMRGGIDSIAELGPTAAEGYMKVLNGKGNAFDLWNSIMNSEGARVYGDVYSQGPSWGSTMIGSGAVSFGGLNAGLYRDYQNNAGDFGRVYKDLNNTVKDETDVEQRISEIMERLPDSFKQSNDIARAQLALDYEKISKQEEDRKLFKQYYDEFMTKMDAIMGVLDVVGGVMGVFNALIGIGHITAITANTAALTANTASQGMGSISNLAGGKNIFGKFGNAINGSKAGSAINKFGSSALGKTMIVAGGAIAAYDMAKTGLDVGQNGFIGADGQRIEGTGGVKDGLAAAFAGSEVKKSTFGNVGGGALSGGLKGAAVGAAIGTVVPVIGTAVGAVVGGAVGIIGGILGGIRKDNARRAEEERQLQLRQLERQKETAENTKQLQSLRDAVLVDRYADYRSGVGGESTSYTSSVSSLSTPGVGGEYHGVDIDGWKVTSEYDPNREPIWIEKEQRYTSGGHAAIDLWHDGGQSAAIGAAYDGEVKKVVTGNDPVGPVANYVQIYHPSIGKTMQYYHLAKAADGITEGSQVKAGQVIGYQGMSGMATGYHLHYNIVGGGDPTPYLTAAMFHPDASITSSSSSSPSLSDVSLSKDAMAVMPSATPGIYVKGKGAGEDGSNIQEFRSSSIEKKLDILNNTLIGMQDKQKEQEKILNALTNTPIYNYGV